MHIRQILILEFESFSYQVAKYNDENIFEFDTLVFLDYPNPRSRKG